MCAKFWLMHCSKGKPRCCHDPHNDIHAGRADDVGGHMARLARWFAVSLTFLLMASFPAGAQPTKLRATVQVAATNPLLGIGLVHLKEEVEKRTDKSLTIEVFDKG